MLSRGFLLHKNKVIHCMEQKNRKYIVWIIGANASGKTSLAATVQRSLREHAINEDKTVQSYEDSLRIANGNIIYTRTSPNSCNIGKFNHPLMWRQRRVETNECCGTDTLPKKDLINFAIQEASIPFLDNDYIFVEGVMATRQWLKMFPTNEYGVLMVLMDIDIENCIQRLALRRSKRKGISQIEALESMNKKTVENIEGKIRGFRKMFDDLICDERISCGMCFQIDESYVLGDAAHQIVNWLYSN